MRQTSKRASSTTSSSSLPNPSSNKVDTARRQRLFASLKEILDCSPSCDHPYAIDRVIQTFDTSTRAELRGLTSIQQERFLAQKALCKTLREQHFTPKATLT
eukprot:2379768-Pleurochrysis_carterae.AAC.1